MSVDRTAIPMLALAAAGIVTILFGIEMYLPLDPSDFGLMGEALLAIFVVAGSLLVGISWYTWKTDRPDVSIAIVVAWIVIALLDPVGLFGVVENTQLAVVIGAGIAGSAAVLSWYLSRALFESPLAPPANG